MALKPEEKLIVKPLDCDKLVEFLQALVPNRPSQNYWVRSEAILKEELTEPTENCLVDVDCCYYLVPEKFHNGKIQLVYTVEVYVHEKTETGRNIGMSPNFLIDISMEQLKLFLKPECTLMEYMGSRYNYNPRIRTNMLQFIEAVGAQVL